MTDVEESQTREPLRFEVRATSESHFSWLRTRLSTERTMMSWARTSIALIGFGFTIVQFFERLQNMSGATPASHPAVARNLGLALIASGIGALVVALLDYLALIRYLRRPEFQAIAGEHHRNARTPVLIVVAVLILIGVCAFTAIVLRLA